MLFSLYQINRSSAQGHSFSGTAIQRPPVMSGIELVDGDGEPRDLAYWQGKNLLVFFGFTHCPDVCPLTLAYLAGLYENLGEPENLQVVMVTVDPERDTPETLTRYVTGFHRDFVGLTGSAEAVAEAAARFYIGYRHRGHGADHPAGHEDGDTAEGMVIHTDTVALLDPQGKMRYIYNQDRLDDLEQDLNYLLAQRTW